MANLLKAQPALQTNYTYSDISAGKSYETFYVSNAGNATTSEAVLLNVATFSDIVWDKVVTAAGASTLLISRDADLTFSLPKTIDGELVANIPFIMAEGIGAPRGFMSCAVVLKKVTGGVETVLVTGNTSTFDEQLDASEMHGVMKELKMTVPRTTFGGNDTFRMTIDVYGYGNTSEDTWIGIGVDPSNRTVPADEYPAGNVDTSLNTKFTVLIPFRIEAI